MKKRTLLLTSALTTTVFADSINPSNEQLIAIVDNVDLDNLVNDTENNEIITKHYLTNQELIELIESGELDENSLAIIVDVANKERVDNQSFNKCGYIIKIDHHKPFDEPFEHLTFVDTNYSSCSEMILDLYLSNSDKFKIDEKGRKAIYTGVVGDTGRFAYIEDPTELFKKLSNITYGLETKDIYANMYRREEKELKFLGYIYSNYKTTENGLAYLKVPKEVVREFELETIRAARMVNALQDTAGIINWHFFAEKEDGSIFCVFRSNGPRVNDIAFKYGGGGHMLAAGASVASWDVINNIIKDMDDNCREFNK